MFFIIGTLVVFGSVLGGYAAPGGHLAVLWQPFEFVIIFGSGIGAFIIGNSKSVLGGMGNAMGTLLKGPAYNKDSYMELLGVLYSMFKLAKSKSDLALESHVENPGESNIFQQFPKFAGDHRALEFLCDYLRLLTLGTNNPYEVDAIMEQELDTHHDENHAISADRANASRRTLIDLGVPESRFSRIVGMAATEPLLADDTENPRNRRLSLVLLRGTGNQTLKVEQPAPAQ